MPHVSRPTTRMTNELVRGLLDNENERLEIVLVKQSHILAT